MKIHPEKYTNITTKTQQITQQITQTRIEKEREKEKEKEREREKSKKIDLLKTITNLYIDNTESPFWNEYTSDINLTRYLDSTNGSLKDAKYKLIKGILYRKKIYINQDINSKCELCNINPESHCMYCIGLSKNGEGIIYLCPAKANDKNTDTLCRHLMIEQDKCFRIEGNNGRLIWIMDYNDYSFGRSLSDSKIGIEFAKILSSCYPERIEKVILVNMPYYFKPVLNLIIKFMDKRTASKLLFCNDYIENENENNNNKNKNNSNSNNNKIHNTHDILNTFCSSEQIQWFMNIHNNK